MSQTFFLDKLRMGNGVRDVVFLMHMKAHPAAVGRSGNANTGRALLRMHILTWICCMMVPVVLAGHWHTIDPRSGNAYLMQDRLQETQLQGYRSSLRAASAAEAFFRQILRVGLVCAVHAIGKNT